MRGVRKKDGYAEIVGERVEAGERKEESLHRKKKKKKNTNTMLRLLCIEGCEIPLGYVVLHYLNSKNLALLPCIALNASRTIYPQHGL